MTNFAGNRGGDGFGRRRLRPVLLALVGDDRQWRADGDRLALGHEDLAQHAGMRGRNLGVDLVGGDLVERVVDGDGITDLLQPLRDRAFGDRLPELGHRDPLHAPTLRRQRRILS
jgi:hypothetical protein